VKRNWFGMAGCLLAWMQLSGTATAQSSYYPFSIDQDRLSGIVDFSYLNSPLEAQDRLFVRSGHFFKVGPDLQPNTADDERVRLYGVNLCFGANFPEPADAERIARRLRRLGVNLVRLHHMDSQPDRTPENAGSTLTTGPYPTLNQVAMLRLRGLLDALSRMGIYVNLNLHVGYTFRPEVDQVPALPSPLSFPTQSKPLHIFNPRMVELQSEYSRKLLEALHLKNDPVLGMVEIDNESSLIYSWQVQQLSTYYTGEYLKALMEQWNQYLRTAYAGTDQLRNAWGVDTPPGLEMMPGSWQLEIHTPASGRFDLTNLEGEPVVVVYVAQGGAPLILKQVGFSINTGKSYLAEVEMRADLPDNSSRSVYWDVKQDTSPWRTVSGKNVDVTNQWKKFTLLLEPAFAIDKVSRFGLSVEKVDKTLYVRRWSLREAAKKGLSATETLEASNIALVSETEASTPMRRDDFQRFLVSADACYLESILETVRQSTDALLPVTGTQVGFGGLTILDSHRKLDYLDNHFYVDHYNFPNVSWDGRDWRIRDSSVVESGLTAFLNLAVTRELGRPFTVSEYNQPWPNTRGAEIDPALAAFASFQDWDSVMHFAYSHGRSWDIGVPNGFNLNGDWGKFIVFGQSARLFRQGALESSLEPLAIPVSSEMRQQSVRERRNGAIADFLTAARGYVPSVALTRTLGLLLSDTEPFPAEARIAPPPPYSSDHGQLIYDPNRKLLLIDSPSVAAILGTIDQQPASSGLLDVECPKKRSNAVFLLTAVDGKDLANSSRFLLSMPGYVLRSQSGVSPARPQQLVPYPGADSWWTIEQEPNYPQKPSGDLNGGVVPVWMERVEATILLRVSGQWLRVFPLDGSGARLSAIPDQDIARLPEGFRIYLQKPGQTYSPWYEIEVERGKSRRKY
jgi:hypothetical protein